MFEKATVVKNKQGGVAEQPSNGIDKTIDSVRNVRTTNCVVTGKVSSSRYVPYKGAGTYTQTLENLSQTWLYVAPRCAFDEKLNANVLSA